MSFKSLEFNTFDERTFSDKFWADDNVSFNSESGDIVPSTKFVNLALLIIEKKSFFELLR